MVSSSATTLPICDVADIIEAWFPGVEANHALANVLFGDTSPSGKLPMSFPYTVGQEPLYYNQFPTGRPAGSADLTVPPGPKTRFISRYIDAPNTALFPFGFGLSYSAFSYDRVSVSKSAIAVASLKPGAKHVGTVTVRLRNSGERRATETVQCYVGLRGAELDQPSRSLKGFRRVVLDPGHKIAVQFDLGFDELAYFDNNGQQKVGPGEYTIWVGGDSTATTMTHFQVKN